MHFRRRGGRTRIVARDGSEIVPSNKPQADGALVKAPARAWRRLKAAEGERRSRPLPPLSGSQARSWALAASLEYRGSAERRYGHDWSFNWLARRRPHHPFRLVRRRDRRRMLPDLLPPAR